MIREYLGVSLALASLLTLSSCEVLRKIQDEAESCETFCSQTYPLHTYPKAEHLESCKRGCKLFVIDEFAGDSLDLNFTHARCVNACTEQYPDSPQYYACSLGCKEQLNQAEAKAKTEQPVLVHALTPLLFIQQVYERVVNRVCHFLQRTFTAVYVQRDTGKLVIVRGELEPVPLPDIDDENPADGGTQPCQGSDCSEDASDSNREFQRESPFPGSTWLDCISRQSGLPRWILVFVLFLVVLTMVWLCCATTATFPVSTFAAGRHHQCYKNQAQKMGLNSDVEYLLLYDPSEQVKIQPPKEQEAAPLPVKIPLDQI